MAKSDYDPAGGHTKEEADAAYAALFKELHGEDLREEPARREKVAVIGHRNPDTDSICSAIAYARLKNAIDPDREYVPYRIGRIGEEASYVLRHFDVPAPPLLADIKARVEDVDYRKTPGVPDDTSLRQAWHLIKSRSIVSLPVTEKLQSGDGMTEKLVGVVTVKDIGKVYLDEMNADLLSQARTPVKNIVSVLNGNLVCGDGEDILTHGEALIAAADDGALFAEYVHPGDIVIVANREELQRIAIREGAGCLVVTIGSVVSGAVLDQARAHGCTVITTAYGTFATARLINQSIPVRFVMAPASGIISFTPKTTLSDVKKVMAKKRYRDFPVLGQDGNYLGMISRRFLLDAPRRSIILVDHNEKAQSVSGIEEARILEIIDHHRLAPVETADPVSFRNQPYGATGTIIYKIYQEQDVALDKQTAGLLLAAVISDTLLFRSPTTTQADRLTGAALANIAGIDMEAFATEIFSASVVVDAGTAGNSLDLLLRDFKTYRMDGKDFGIGQINFPDRTSLEDAVEALASALSEARLGRRVDVIYALLTDISATSSVILYDGDNAADILATAFGKTPEGNRLFLEGVVSRKKQFVPEIFQAL